MKELTHSEMPLLQLQARSCLQQDGQAASRTCGAGATQQREALTVFIADQLILEPNAHNHPVILK